MEAGRTSARPYVAGHLSAHSLRPRIERTDWADAAITMKAAVDVGRERSREDAEGATRRRKLSGTEDRPTEAPLE